ncbi:uncharacterized protein DNG_04464 [Cephalotrichum gorgonifer]|uniref:Uncharacterized protein n=1 Tax=Cephalotrichum gorgonifer TaxID=2041049 RepID=A0AAE8MW61_9PEZI|nr:uncharacterized protein DNG_04464 [Cephalotrichum gorgonifer]
MSLISLPTELLHHILYYSILARDFPDDFRRALRLKLVCKSFNESFRTVLFTNRLLDHVWGGHLTFENWQNCRYYGADVLWHDYLAMRSREETDESVGRFVEIRNTANSLLRHHEAHRLEHDIDLNLDVVLDGLCWLALERGGARCPASRETWSSIDRVSGEVPNPGLNLLSAGAYFGCTPLVRELLIEGYDGTRDNDLFPCPMFIAAWTGQDAMLQLLQEFQPDVELTESNNRYFDFSCRSKIAPGSVDGASIRGDMDMKPGHIAKGTWPYTFILSGMQRARSPEVFDYLERTLSQEKVSQRDKDQWLSKRAAAGDIVMVRHLLDIGADPVGETTAGGPPLVHAVRAWHEDIVDLLLERGADPNERGKYRRGTPLTAAARAGSMVMLKKLLDAGAKLAKEDYLTLRGAARMEHTAMVELLLRICGRNAGMGAEIEAWRRQWRERYLPQLQLEGLESMVDILRPWVEDGWRGNHS